MLEQKKFANRAPLWSSDTLNPFFGDQSVVASDFFMQQGQSQWTYIARTNRPSPFSSFRLEYNSPSKNCPPQISIVFGANYNQTQESLHRASHGPDRPLLNQGALRIRYTGQTEDDQTLLDRVEISVLSKPDITVLIARDNCPYFINPQNPESMCDKPAWITNINIDDQTITFTYTDEGQEQTLTIPRKTALGVLHTPRDE